MVQVLTTQDGTINLVTNQEYIVPEGELITSSGNTFSLSSQTSVVLVIEGSVFAGGGDGTADNSATDNVMILVGATGSVTAWSDGIELSATNAQVRNHGSIVGLGDSGVELVGAGSYLSNSGTIEGVGHGVQTDGADSIVNSGLIVGERGVDMRGGNTQLTNSGTIQSPGPVSTSVDTAGVFFYTGDGFVIRNTGLISGAEYSIKTTVSGSDDALIVNDGTLDGDVGLNDGVQQIRNSGTILGDISMGGGDDRYNGRSGTIVGEVDGGGGNDRLRGGTGDETFQGGPGDDTVNGRKGDDVLSGEGGHDLLRGGKGDDVLDGGGRQDTLIAGSGNDTLTGGGGNDRFVFNRDAGDNIITDMTNGSDKIDLSAFGIQNFNRLNNLGAISSEAGGVKIDLNALGGSGSIWLEGFSIADLNGADFIF